MDVDIAQLDSLLEEASQLRASDVHVAVGEAPRARIDGALRLLAGHPLPVDAEWLERAITRILPPRDIDAVRLESEIDFSHDVPGVGRFRVSVYRQLGQVAAAFRLIPEKAASLRELGLPPIARDLALRPRGLVFVTGPTGSGKSTTLSAMVDEINNAIPSHIITLEDPIEFIHRSRVAMIHQREIGSDTASFAEGLRRVLRQDPDVILIGELRDPESISVALSAAETGQLVLATLHTQGAAKSINRILDAFPAHQQAQIRTQLSETLQGVISQTLLPLAQSEGRVLATEVLVNTAAVANLIREGQVQQLTSAMQSGSSVGMHTMDQSLRALVESGTVSLHAARASVVDRHALDGVTVRPRDLDAEAWSVRASDHSLSGWGRR